MRVCDRCLGQMLRYAEQRRAAVSSAVTLGSRKPIIEGTWDPNRERKAKYES